MNKGFFKGLIIVQLFLTRFLSSISYIKIYIKKKERIDSIIVIFIYSVVVLVYEKCSGIVQIIVE
jgi:hypothetical protein